MFRYVALIWDARDSRQVETAQAATRRLKSGRAAMAGGARSAPACACCVPTSSQARSSRTCWAARAGVVLGSLFTRKSDPADETPARACALDEVRTAAIVDSHGEWLVRNAWGNYVAFICDPLRGSIRVLKDPCGSLPCFSTTFGGITVVFSCNRGLHAARCEPLHRQSPVHRAQAVRRRHDAPMERAQRGHADSPRRVRGIQSAAATRDGQPATLSGVRSISRRLATCWTNRTWRPRSCATRCARARRHSLRAMRAR